MFLRIEGFHVDTLVKHGKLVSIKGIRQGPGLGHPKPGWCSPGAQLRQEAEAPSNVASD